jgi:molybdopterin-guanine dinucleotide biosynthesis protein A
MNGTISGVILAGGSASRLQGMIKPKIIIEGRPIITRILSVIRDLFGEIIIVTNTRGEFFDFKGCRIIADEITGAGPLGGIHAAMKASECESVFVFAGDMPYLDRSLIVKMIQAYHECGCKALIPSVGGSIEPLHSVYSNSLLDKLQTFLSSGQEMAVRAFIKTIDVRFMEMAASEGNKRIFTNINSPMDMPAG